ncbi:hypothetical protein EVC29_105 [Rhizobium phage RHph_Y52]|nr:hypothetical protein EVC16_105 [Rhizobium phage RHph_Y21]QIG76806.1 hypothetical protein EVC29_105 [Rhizobium phage RHph_Y52]
MNKERILQLADHIENLPDPSKFDMGSYGHRCGAPACFAGHTFELFAGGHRETLGGGEIHATAASLLDLTDVEADRLFTPSTVVIREFGQIDHITPYDISNKTGAKVLRHFAETGTIDFEV